MHRRVGKIGMGQGHGVYCSSGRAPTGSSETRTETAREAERMLLGLIQRWMRRQGKAGSPFVVAGLSLAGSVDRALACLRQNGMVVIQDALDPGALFELCKAVKRYEAAIRCRIDTGRGFEDVDANLNFHEPTYAADLVALDPATAGQENRLQISATTFHRAVMQSPLRGLLERLVSIYASWSMARIRLIFPDLHGQERSGSLQFHQEKIVTPFAGVHNLWVPLVDSGIVTGENAPGIQFYVGPLDELRNRGQDVVQEQRNQDLLLKLTRNAQVESYVDEKGFLFRPRLKLGDVAVFEASIPHGSYLPPHAREPRANIDVRLFPTPFDPGPKPFFQ